MKFLDRSQSDKSEKEVERMLKGATINTLTVGEGNNLISMAICIF